MSRSPDVPLLPTLVTAALGGAAAMALLRRRRRSDDSTPLPPATPIRPSPPRPAERPAQDAFRCACGQEFRVVGQSRHRVLWPAGAAEDDPVIDDACPSCGRSLAA